MAKNTPRRLRVLLSSFAIAPNHGSEKGVGWNVATRLAKHHDVTVLCGDLDGSRSTEKELESYFRVHGRISGLEICYVPPSDSARAFHWMHAQPGMWFLYYTAYENWQRTAYARAMELHSHEPFDLIHQLTFATYREPGYLWRLPVPFFWGPVAGASSPPLRMLNVGGTRLLLRHFGNAVQRRFSRRAASAARKASVTWVVTEDDRCLIERWGGRAEWQCEVGTSHIAAEPRARREDNLLRLIWSGIHVARKGLPLALETIARLPKGLRCHLDILGTGPMTMKCQALSRRLGLEPLVTWHGQLAQRDALAVMSKAHAFFHTSVSEGTSTVVLEALALGMPVVCHDACGMKTAVTDQCGIKIPLKNRETSIRGFCEAIERLDEPRLYNKLANAALERAKALTWDSKAASISEAYMRHCR
jgi:glycosyltransferase involved in cell wall biosynthesis